MNATEALSIYHQSIRDTAQCQRAIDYTVRNLHRAAYRRKRRFDAITSVLSGLGLIAIVFSLIVLVMCL